MSAKQTLRQNLAKILVPEIVVDFVSDCLNLFYSNYCD